MCLSHSVSRQRGFNLVEMLITLAVLAILLAVALPTFRDLIGRNQVSSASNALSADLAYARTEAITRGASVFVCPRTSDGSDCMNPDLGSSYASGWLVYTYKPGTRVSGAVFSRDSVGGLLLRKTTGLRGLSIRATDGKAIGFDQLGQFKSDVGSANPRLPPSFLICSMAAAGGIGMSTTHVPGTSMVLAASGSVRHAVMASGMPCST